MEENNYYPFGLKHENYNSEKYKLNTTEDGVSIVLEPTERNVYQYKFLGQERQDELGLNWDNFRHRNYDYAIARFMSVDPISEEYMSISTYQFAHNNPVWKIEIEGLEGKETQGKDLVNHEPIKVQHTPTQGFVGGGLVETKIIQKAATEVVKKESTSVLSQAGQTLIRGIGLGVMLLSDNMSPNYGGRTSEMQPANIPGTLTSTNPTTGLPPPTVSEDNDDKIIYRGGAFTENNFTPRIKDTDGLSTNTDPLAATQGRGGKAQGLSSNLLKKMGFELNKSGNHVSVRPPSQQLLEEWAKTKGLPPNSSPAQIFTQMVMAARIREVNIQK